MAERTLQRNTLLIFGSRMGNSVLMFVGVFLFARSLGAGGLGEFFLFQSVLTILLFATDLSLGTAAEKRISEGEARPVVISTALSLKFLVLPVVCVLIVLFRPWVNGYIGAEASLLLVVGLVVGGIGNFFLRILSGDLRIGSTAVPQFSRQVVWLFGGLVLVGLGWGSMALIVAYVAGLTVMTVWALVRCDLAFGRPTVAQARSLVRYARFEFVAGSSHRIHNWADVLIIGYFLSPAAVGAYEVAWRITVLAGILSTSLSQVLFPEVSSAEARDAIARIREAINTSIIWSIILAVPAFFGALFLSEEILALVFEIEMAGAGLVLSILLFGKIFHAQFTPLNRALAGVGRVDLSARATAVSAVVNVVANVVLIWYAGIVGAAVATTLSMFTGFALAFVYTRSQVEFPYPRFELGVIVTAATVMSVAVLVLTNALAVTTMARLFAVVAGGGAVYVALLLAHEMTRGFLVDQYHQVSGAD